jgi:formate C-acetyltransferase
VVKYCDGSVSPKPYKSLLTEGCLESGRDFNARGAKYDYYQVMLGGIPNLADSLEVIRRFVFEEKAYTLEEIRDILEQDFPDEAVRVAFLRRADKFGNDKDGVDSLAVAITNRACDTLQRLSREHGHDYHAQPFTFLWMIDHGHHSAASPDGRRRGEIIAYSVSPMQGRDYNGLTALLRSISRLPTRRTPGTTSAIVEVDPKLFAPKNLDALTSLLLGAAAEGLSNVQFNTVDVKTLRDAQKHPENYRNLAVRVSGFSQKFHLLSPEMQEHIIGRTKHQCL